MGRAGSGVNSFVSPMPSDNPARRLPRGDLIDRMNMLSRRRPGTRRGQKHTLSPRQPAFRLPDLSWKILSHVLQWAAPSAGQSRAKYRTLISMRSQLRKPRAKAQEPAQRKRGLFYVFR